MTTTPGAPDPHADFALEAARARQSFPMALLAGVAASAVAAAIWAGITAATEYQIGFMAIGVGIAVGLAVRLAGRGVDASFRVLGAILALLGCAAGNLLAACIFFATAHEVGLARALEVLDLELATNLMRAMFSPMDLLFYAIAVWEAWRLSIAAPAVTAPAA
jgi:hypothetical protein